jgi:hypothetical protein
MAQPDNASFDAVPSSLLKRHCTFPTAPSDTTLGHFPLERAETANTLSGATLASRHQSVGDEDASIAPPGRPRPAGSPDIKSDGQGSWLHTDPKLKPIVEARTGSRSYVTAGLRSKLFQTLQNQNDVFLQSDNFATESDVDILWVDGGDAGQQSVVISACRIANERY